MRKFESSRKDESRAQSADSSKKPIENVELIFVSLHLVLNLKVGKIFALLSLFPYI